MSYQRVWSQVRAMNNDFVEPLVLTPNAEVPPVGARGSRPLASGSCRSTVRSSATPNAL